MNRILRLAPLLLVFGCVMEPMIQQSPDGPRPVAAAPVVQPVPVQVIEVPPPLLRDDEIVEVYLDVFGRYPGDHEVWEWHQRCRETPIRADDVRHALRESGEFRELSPELIVRRAFRDCRRGEPTDFAMRYYRRRLLDEHWSAGRVHRAVERREDEDRDGGRPASPHYSDAGAERRGRDRGEGHDRRREIDAHSPDAVIERAYDDLLERKPDRDGREHYRRLLAQGRTEDEIRHLIKESEEYRVTLPDAKTTRAYREVLGRNPDQTGLQSYRKKIVDYGWTEEDVKRDLRKSAEYRNRKK